MSRATRSDRTRRSRVQPDAPAYWINNEQMRVIERYVEEGNTESLADLVRRSARVVPRAEGVETTLIGELLNLLGNAGVPLPQGIRSPHGILLTLGASETAAVEEEIGKFMSNADDENLSRDPSLILYANAPHLVRRGIEYLRKALRIPSGYDALLLLAR